MPVKLIEQKNVTLKIFDDRQEGCEYVAGQIQKLITEHNRLYKSTVLGLATGNTPKGVYKKLVEYHQRQQLSFNRVVTFNLDEYYPISAYHDRSYHTYMEHNLFNKVDVHPHHTFIPDGEVPEEELATYCENYDHQINHFGGVDIQLLGVGVNGHIGFNEPGSKISSTTRRVFLDEQTRHDAAPYFGEIDQVPRQAISMGVHTILKARKIICMAWGAKKATTVKEFFEDEITVQRPVSYLHTHPNVHLVLDKEAASQLELD